MFRLTHYLREIVHPTPIAPPRAPSGPVVIWNLVRRCNLTCKHCYSISGDVDFPGELTTAQVFGVMDDLKSFGVPVLILSGGEPLLRRDIFDITARAKAMRFYVGLSTNGTLIDATLADRIRGAGYDYVGISLDGIGQTHDRFRRKEGAYEAALGGLRALRERGVKVGVRFTMTADNAAELPAMLDLVEREGFPKFYLSHLVYAGRGNKNRADDAAWATTRDAMELLIARAWQWVRRGSEMEVVTGNNDADAVYLLIWAARRAPAGVPHLRAKLAQWGGNSSGVNIANIDNLGNVHPDTMWWHYSLGNVKERPFSQIWTDLSDPIMAGLKRRPRAIGGRCASCAFFDVCGGNTRVRALRITGDPWAEDPGCYLDDAEIGLSAPAERITVRPFRGARHEPQTVA
ncbi:MAG TPA: heme d1 biosynthesis radical SAM protein NirJ [Xanthobacteraceae bacterium]